MTDTPTNIKSVRTGNYTVHLSWSSLNSNTTPVSGYEVFYAKSGSEESNSGGNTRSTTIIVTLPTLGVACDLFVVAFSDAENTNNLPSARSSTVIINMSKCKY